MNATYRKHVAERAELGIPPLPLDAGQAEELCRLLSNPSADAAGAELVGLLENRVPPGVDEAARVKADFLHGVAAGRLCSPPLSPLRAVELLGTMLGGYNVARLVQLLDDLTLGEAAAAALRRITQAFDSFRDVEALRKRGNRFAREVVESWAEAEWFFANPPLPERLALTVFKVDGEINTDDFSPAGHASTRPDIPLHSLCMGEKRFPGGVAELARLRAAGREVAFVGDVVGTGSSRKSATNSLIWHIGRDIPQVPNKRRGGVVLGGSIAPIFFNTFQDAGGLPVRCDVSRLRTGMEIVLLPQAGKILDAAGEELASFTLAPTTLADEYRAGGRVPLIVGRKLTVRAREALGKGACAFFVMPETPARKPGQGYTLAQKLVGRACGRDGVLPGETCEPATATVGSQDTTGPMTRDELLELACLKFQAPLVLQSFCHTAAYPKEKDLRMHQTLPGFISGRGGVALRPGDGIIHSWLNRLLLPDTVGTGGDSHTRFPLGISFPAGSGLVAFAAALGCMPLDMPESVLVKVSGTFREGITLRDLVNAVALQGIEQGLIDRPGSGTRNVFNSRIMEIEGLPGLTVEQAFELTNASAERSAAAATVALEPESVAEFCRSNVALIRSLLAAGYENAEALLRRAEEVERWLENPRLLRRDDRAEFAATVEIDLGQVDEPVLACPNNPDNARRLGEVAGAVVDEVFIGSCMTNIGHFRAAARILAGGGIGIKRLWVTPPTRMDRDRLEQEGVLEILRQAGARVELPGCSLCMGNQARVADRAVVFSTSTRNFDNRIGDGAQVYLGSAELAAVTAKLGRIPTKEEYLREYRNLVAPHRDAVYNYLNFHRLPEYGAGA